VPRGQEEEEEELGGGWEKEVLDEKPQVS